MHTQEHDKHPFDIPRQYYAPSLAETVKIFNPSVNSLQFLLLIYS